MAAKKFLRLGLWGAVVIAGGAALGGYYLSSAERQEAITSAAESGQALIGGPFSLVGPGNVEVTEADLMGQPFVIFFGFTHCPDVCPTSLFEMANWIDDLGPAADGMEFVFVTVDPERDTPDVMENYVGSFSDQILPLSGTVEQVDAMTQAYRIYAAKVPLDGDDYTMDHSAFVYLMDGNGQYVSHIGYGENTESALEKLKALAASA